MGLVLYELVAGRGPFDELRGQRDALRFAHCEREPPPPSRIAPQPIPPAVEQLILRAIAKAPERRFQTAAAMEATIRRILGDAWGHPLPRQLPAAGASVPAPALDPTEIDVLAQGNEPAGKAEITAWAPTPGARAFTGRACAALAERRCPAPRSRLRAQRPRRYRRGATHTGVIGVCALAVASAALSLVIAQRWAASDASAAQNAPAAYIESHPRSAVR
jgi:hypothetical protein